MKTFLPLVFMGFHASKAWGSTCTSPEPDLTETVLTFDDMCYLVYSKDVKLKWYDAKLHCLKINGQLIRVNNYELQTYIGEMLRDGDEFWTGLSSIPGRGWIYPDGKRAGLTPWQQPFFSMFTYRVYISLMWGSAAMEYTNDDTWTRRFICQRGYDEVTLPRQDELTHCKAREPDLTEAVLSLNDICYLVYSNDKKLTWADAKGHCHEINAQMVRVKYTEINHFLSEMLQNGESANSHPAVEPSNDMVTQRVYIIPRGPGTSLAMWYTDDEASKRRFICQHRFDEVTLARQEALMCKAREPHLTETALTLDDMCYLVYSKEKTLYWNDAKDHCQKVNGQLIRMNHHELDLYLSKMLQTGDEFWTGLSKLPGTGWIYPDGESAVISPSMDPSDDTGTYRVYISPRGTGASLSMWYTDDEASKRRFICQYRLEDTTSPQPNTATTHTPTDVNPNEEEMSRQFIVDIKPSASVSKTPTQPTPESL